MTTGALIFAFNTSHHDYVKMATWQAYRIKRWLKIPVSLVTDQQLHDSVWDQIIVRPTHDVKSQRWFADANASVQWNNFDRCDALAVSPYQRTLLLDADYVIASKELKLMIDHGPEIWCYHQCYDAATGDMMQPLNEFGNFHMPMSWCTVLCFSNTVLSQYLFDCWQMIRDNWEHYRQLYAIPERLFRNDYALTIALTIINGHGKYPVHPSPMCAVMPTAGLETTSDPDQFRIHYVDRHGRSRHQTLRNQDFHAMGKQHLMKLIDAHA